MIWIILGVALILTMFAMIMIVLFSSGSGDDRTNRGEEIAGTVDGGAAGSLNRADSTASQTAETAAKTTTRPTAAGIGNVVVGDRVHVSGAGDLSDLDFRVSGSVRYSSDREDWTEYYGSYRGRQVAVETFDDDAFQVGVIAAEATITLAQLGLTEDDLIRWDEGDGPGRPFEFDGATWESIWSGEVTYFEDDFSHRKGYYGWDFAEQGGPRILCVEKREGEPFEVILMQLVDANRVRISGN